MFYVYKMIHTPTGRVYIGQRKLPKGKTPETDGYYGSGKVWRSIYKAHPEECVKTVLEVVESKEEVDELEKKYIAHYRSVYGGLCVNITDGGGGHCGKLSLETRKKMSLSRSGEKNPFFGKHFSEVHRKNLSESHKGQTPWNKGLKGENNPNYGKHHSEETRKKIAESHKGKQLSEEHRRKLSESKMGEKHPNFGKHLSEDTRKKISEVNRGKRPSEEARRKMSESRIGKKHSEETKRKMSEAHKARKNRKENN